jgi:hypothetical protein
MYAPLRTPLAPGRIVTWLGAVAGLLVLAHVVAAYAWAHGDWWIFTEQRWVDYKYVQMLDLDEEEGFGTWFAAMTLLFAGRLLLLVGRDSRGARDGLWGWWLGLGIGFHILSIDEVAGMHEYVNAYGEDFGWGDTKWTLYAAVLVLLVALAYVPFLVHLVQRGAGRTAGLLIAAGVLYVGGAVVIEKLSPDDELNSLSYNMGWITLEEGLEMSGVLLLLYALLDYLRGGRGRRLVVTVDTVDTESAAADQPEARS